MSFSAARFDWFILFLPYNPLSAFTGLDPNGEWTLGIYDAVEGNTGSLEAWGLTLFFEPVAGVGEISTNVITDYRLAQNYPNPFNPITNIEIQIPVSGFVTLTIYNTLGQEVKRLAGKRLAPGVHRYQFDGTHLARGVYYYKLALSTGFVQTKKLVLLK